jgi:hypothetical protein
MTRIIAFADGFTSATAPDIEGTSLETYEIANNSSGVLFTLDPTEVTSAFISYELLRSDSSRYEQAGKIICLYNGTSWSIQPGNYIGEDLIQDTVTLPQHVVLSFNGNDLEYESGNMGGSYSGEIKLSITRINA